MDLLVNGSFGLSNATFTDAATNEPRFRTSSKRMQWGNHWDTTLYAIPTGTPNASRYVADDTSEDTLVAEEDPAKFADLEIIGTLHLATYYTDSGHTLIVNSRDITPKRVHMLTTGETFVASNGREYKWRIESTLGGDSKFYDRETKQVVAEYISRRRLSRKPGQLHVTEEGLSILNEIIATLVYKIRRWNNGW
ncbi:hypothetical protein K523DRAFT_315474 [Schizophyllum commune Tattone D]|nr:hypothetical protein K523DRAFT_315474 [Schizophyllum commune Tattone D]